MKKLILLLLILLIPSLSYSGTLTTSGDVNFSVGDILRIKNKFNDEWMNVTNATSAPTYTVTRDMAGQYAPNANPAWKKGTSIVDYGQPGAGGIFMTASESNAPYLSVLTHAGAPWNTTTTQMRLGNLNGYLDYGTDLYGIAIGKSDAYLKYDPTNGLQIKGVITATSGSDIGSSAQLLQNGNFENWTAGTSSAPDGWTLSGAGASVAREASTIKLGTYSAKLTRAGTDTLLGQQIDLDKGIAYWKGRTVTFGCWVYATVADRARLQINDDITTYSSYHTGDGTWQWLTVTKTIGVGATSIYVFGRVWTGNTSAYFDGAMCVEGSVAMPFSEKNYSEQWIHSSDTTKIDGGDIYTGTVSADKITAGTYVGGNFVVGAG
ncbi:MAG: carbohydrate binding domain-containing protein, partial [Nitrospirota bacterium]